MRRRGPASAEMRWNISGFRPFDSWRRRLQWLVGRAGSIRVLSGNRMSDLSGYASRPLAFTFRYIRLRPVSHAVILAAVLGAVACSTGTQYGVKFLVDTLSGGANAAVWTAFCVLGGLIAADNLLWRIAAWIANFAFVGVSGDLRRDLFRHLMGHSPSYFADRLPGMLTS